MSSQQQSAMTHRRFWVRSDRPQRPWWPWAWLPLLGLLGLFLLGVFYLAPHIEAQVHDQVTQQVAAGGVGIVASSASGQELTLRGIGDVERAGLLEAAAAGTRCPTWAGDLICPTHVSLELRPQEVVAVEPPAPPRWHDFDASALESGLILIGEVSSEADRQRWIAAARQRFESVTDQLTVSSEPGHPQDSLAQLRALETLRGLTRGRSTWIDGVLSVDGFAPGSEIAALEAAFSNADGAPRLGTFGVEPIVEADQCNQALATALTESTIRFRTASAEIDPASQPLLEQLATLARPCPGQLRIEGHTDSVGDAASNQQLSQARADAVRNALIELGVGAGRLQTVGKGEAEPIATNDTAEGRAANRRIVITAASNSGP